MLRGLRGRVLHGSFALILPAPHKPETTTLLSGLFLALPRSYRLSIPPSGPGLSGKTKALRDAPSESLTAQPGWSPLEVGPRPRTVRTLRPTLVGWAVNK